MILQDNARRGSCDVACKARTGTSRLLVVISIHSCAEALTHYTESSLYASVRSSFRGCAVFANSLSIIASDRAA